MKWIVFIISIVSLATLTGISWKFAGYRKTYFFIAFLTVLFFVLTFIEFARPNEILESIMNTCTLALPLFLLALSIRNLNVNTDVPRIFTVANLVLSAGIIIVLIIAIMSAVGGTIIG